MTLESALLIFGSGVVGGIMNALAGGGTIVTFPALLAAGIDPIVANATSTVAVLPGTYGSLSAYRSHIPAVASWLRIFAPVSLLGGLAGGILLTLTPARVFDSMVPFLILGATVLFMFGGVVRRLLMRNRSVHDHTHSSAWLAGAAAFQFAVSVYGGYFGAGIGILMLASFGILGFRDIHQMNAMKTVLGALANTMAALYFAFTLPVRWPEAAVLAAGTIAGGYYGAVVAQKVPQPVVRAAVVIIGLGIGFVLWRQRFG